MLDYVRREQRRHFEVQALLLRLLASISDDLPVSLLCQLVATAELHIDLHVADRIGRQHRQVDQAGHPWQLIVDNDEAAGEQTVVKLAFEGNGARNFGELLLEGSEKRVELAWIVRIAKDGLLRFVRAVASLVELFFNRLDHLRLDTGLPLYL